MSDAREFEYNLYYWPGLPGRGEFVRLILEDGGAAYSDVARLPESEGGGVPAILAFLKGQRPGLVPLAPPFLQVGELVLAQTANICLYLARRLSLVPESQGAQAEAMQLLLTVADFVAEVHDTHHPVTTTLPYEEQKDEAKKRTHLFLAQRLPKFMGYFDNTISRHGGTFALGAECTCVDLALFQLISGMRYAFPRSFARTEDSIPHVIGVHDRVADRPNIATYLASERRLPFGQSGIFRQYPELDE